MFLNVQTWESCEHKANVMLTLSSTLQYVLTQQRVQFASAAASSLEICINCETGDRGKHLTTEADADNNFLHGEKLP